MNEPLPTGIEELQQLQGERQRLADMVEARDQEIDRLNHPMHCHHPG